MVDAIRLCNKICSELEARDDIVNRVAYWFLVLASGSWSMSFRMRWPLRFTLRSLFVVTTFLAVVLRMSAWLDWAWIGM